MFRASAHVHSFPRRPRRPFRRGVARSGCPAGRRCSLPGVCCPPGTTCHNNVCRPIGSTVASRRPNPGPSFSQGVWGGLAGGAPQAAPEPPPLPPEEPSGPEPGTPGGEGIPPTGKPVPPKLMDYSRAQHAPEPPPLPPEEPSEPEPGTPGGEGIPPTGQPLPPNFSGYMGPTPTGLPPMIPQLGLAGLQAQLGQIPPPPGPPPPPPGTPKPIPPPPGPPPGSPKPIPPPPGPPPNLTAAMGGVYGQQAPAGSTPAPTQGAPMGLSMAELPKVPAHIERQIVAALQKEGSGGFTPTIPIKR